MNLAQLSLQRAQLPKFSGVTYVEQLLNGRAAAAAVLSKYVPNFGFDLDAAEQTMREVGVWEERNRKQLEVLVSDPSSSALPEAVRVAMGNDKAQAFILAGFTQAAWGLGPWVSGAIEREAASGQKIQTTWAQDDAEARLAVFGSIVKMDNDGYLQKLFVPPAGTAGLGWVPVVIEGSTLVWAVVVTLVAVAALVIGYLYLSKTLTLNNRLMRDLCEKAQKEGDQATIAACIKETAGLQKPPGLESLTAEIGKAVLVVGLAYVLLKTVPSMLKKRSA